MISSFLIAVLCMQAYGCCIVLFTEAGFIGFLFFLFFLWNSQVYFCGACAGTPVPWPGMICDRGGWRRVRAVVMCSLLLQAAPGRELVGGCDRVMNYDGVI